MRCRALCLVALLVSGAAMADATVAAPATAPGPAVAIAKGAPAPDDGVFLATSDALAVAKKCAQAEADREKFRQQVADQPLPSGSVLITVGVVGLVIGAIVGGIAVAVAKK